MDKKAMFIWIFYIIAIIIEFVITPKLVAAMFGDVKKTVFYKSILTATILICAVITTAITGRVSLYCVLVLTAISLSLLSVFTTSRRQEIWRSNGNPISFFNLSAAFLVAALGVALHSLTGEITFLVPIDVIVTFVLIAVSLKVANKHNAVLKGKIPRILLLLVIMSMVITITARLIIVIFSGSTTGRDAARAIHIFAVGSSVIICCAVRLDIVFGNQHSKPRYYLYCISYFSALLMFAATIGFDIF